MTDGPRRGEDDPFSPNEEQVADLAYPRNYVDDHVAQSSRSAFQSLPRSASPSSFRSVGAYNAAKATTPVQWSALGPVTPNVSSFWTQFYNPVTRTGPSTQESGRVTALAIDPNCAPGACRMWVAAAGGGIWRTNDALASSVQWIAPSAQLPTNSFGSLYYDASTDILYAGSGEPNGSSDSEAGLGLFRSTDFGATWTLVPGSFSVGISRSIGSIAIDHSTTPATIYIGTDVARHGSSSVNGGRRTPPNAPSLGVYRSTDGGQTFTLESDLSAKTPPSPNAPSTGNDWFQGGINKLEFDPNNPHMLYAAVFGYGIWRADQSGPTPSWSQVFHTMNQNNFSDPNNPVGDTTGDRTEFDLVDRSGTTGIYVGDASDDFVNNPGSGPLPQAWRNYAIASVTGDPNGNYTNPPSDGWVPLSSATRTDTGFGVYGFCQNGQCGYDEFVSSPPGQPNTVWYGGSMNYAELFGDDRNGLGSPPISNGRAVVRSTNADIGSVATASTIGVTWQDMTAVLADPSAVWNVQQGIHPDLHAIAFAQGGNTAFIGSDGGVVRIDVSNPQDQTASCSQRTWAYGGPGTPDQPLSPADVGQCQMLLRGVPDSITPLNNGLVDLQYQSLSASPSAPRTDILGGTQDNGTWSLNGGPVGTEVVGGDGGQSGFNKGNSAIRFHNFFNATPDVNYHGGRPPQWLDTYDVLQASGENQSFYSPFTTDPVTPGRAFIGLQHVWRTDDDGGGEAALVANGCNELAYAATSPCGDWQRIGPNLTGNLFGTSRNGQFVVATVRAASDAGTLWAATRTGRVFVTKNAAARVPSLVGFHRIDTPSTPGRFVSGIAVDPTNPNHVWISFSGYNAYTPTTPGHVFEVTYHPRRFTATWVDRSYNLGDQPITGIVENEQTGDLYAASDFGVLRLAAGSRTWANSAPGLPQVAVYGLTYVPSAHLMYGATHGRGAFSLRLPVR